MKSYVFIGFNGLFGDYADIVHACGGRLRKVVINLPIDTVTGTRSFADQLEGRHRWLESMGVQERIEVQLLRDFQPETGDHHVLAARGVALAPLRNFLVNQLGVVIEPLVHPSALISPTVELPAGLIVRAGARVGADARLGAFSSLGTGCYIGHDVGVAEFADLGPGVHVASGARVGRGARLGIQSTLINGVSIGEEAQVAAGAVVIRDVARLTLVAGVPAVVKKALEPRSVSETVPGLA